MFWYPRWVLEANQEDPSVWMPLLAIAEYILLDRYTISLSLVWLICNPLDYSPPDSSVHGISQARILEWVAISFSRDLPDEPASTGLAGRFFTADPPRKLTPAAAAKSLRSCSTPCDPIDGSHWSGLPFPSPMRESEK